MDNQLAHRRKGDSLSNPEDESIFLFRYTTNALFGLFTLAVDWLAFRPLEVVESVADLVLVKGQLLVAAMLRKIRRMDQAKE